jgi:osmotically-inducible protein OsmY
VNLGADRQALDGGLRNRLANLPMKPGWGAVCLTLQERKVMKIGIPSRILAAGTLLAGLSWLAGVSLAADDAGIARGVTHELVSYPYYTLWDELNFTVANGQVELGGAVTQPFKKQDIERLVSKVPGVISVADNIKVLPLSDFDDRLRRAVADAIYRDPVLSRYAGMGWAPIHIIVDNGHVTLAGKVNSDMEKEIAGLRASQALSFGTVVNNLVVEHPASKKS